MFEVRSPYPSRDRGRGSLALLGASLLLLALATSGCRSSTAAPSPAPPERTAPRIVKVNGIAQIDVVPDVVDVSISLQLTRPAPKAAMEELERQKDTLLEALKGVGISRKDVLLGQIQLSPEYDRYPRNHKLLGFRASIDVSVCLSQFERLSGVMQAAATAGASRLGTRFRSTKMQETKVRARTLAVKAARRKAEQLTRALGVKVGRVLTISETQSLNWGGLALGNTYVRPTRSTQPLQPGAIAVSLTVYAEFELR